MRFLVVFLLLLPVFLFYTSYTEPFDDTRITYVLKDAPTTPLIHTVRRVCFCRFLFAFKDTDPRGAFRPGVRRDCFVKYLPHHYFPLRSIYLFASLSTLLLSVPYEILTYIYFETTTNKNSKK